MPRERSRDYGDGAIYQRKSDGRYVGAINLGTGPGGKRRRKVVYGDTRTEVVAALRQLRTQSRSLQKGEDPRLTVDRFLSAWLEATAPGLKPTTAEFYERVARVHLMPTLGHLRLVKLAPEHFGSLYAQKQADGLSPRTIAGIHRVVRIALNYAVTTGRLPYSPMTGVKAPRIPKGEYSLYGPAELQRLGLALRNDYLGALYYLVASTGCRRGEACALRWQDVDIESGWVHINRAAAVVNKCVIFQDPKTDDGRRKVKLPPEAVEWLRRHRVAQDRHRLLVGGAYKSQDLVFARPDGSPLVPGHVTQHFALVVRKAGLPPIKLHELRHTHATLLLAAGADEKAVSDRMGHRSPLTTRQLYQHIIPSMQEHVADMVQSILTSGQTNDRKKATKGLHRPR